MSEYIEQLEKLLSENFEEVCIDTISDLSKPGENYMSHVYEVDAIVKNPSKARKEIIELHVVVKVIKKGITQDFKLLTMDLFTKEICFYSEIVPTLKNFQLEDGNSRKLEFFAKCVAFRNNRSGNKGVVDENALLIFENLKHKGEKTLSN